MEVASQTVGEVVKILMGYIKKHLGYITSYAKHVDHMEERLKVLDGKHIDVKNQKDENKTNNKEVPARVPGWLYDVEKITKEVESITSNSPMGCFNMKGRHRAAIKALKATERIEELITENSMITWRDTQIPFGRVDSKPATMFAASASTSTSDAQSGFKSRNKTFNDVLKLLQQVDEKTRVIALHGMGGVGKTTMMNQLKEVARNKKMFKWIVPVVIGRDYNLESIQNDIAFHTGDPLPKVSIKLRANSLRKRFEEFLKRGEKSLVILDDVWDKVELEDIGLSPLPNGVKLFLTSRYVNACKQIATDVDSNLEVIEVKVLDDAEALDFFCQITGVSKERQHDLYQIGGRIVKKCGGLPLAIKLIAATLKFEEEESLWRDTLSHMENNNPGEDVEKVIELSYNYIKKGEEKAIFLLCGMFPEDSYIAIEDLTRYAWGLNLLEDVSTLRKARDRTLTIVRNLTNANLLIDSDDDHRGSVKIHDLVLSFVVNRVSKGEDAWIINHGDMSNWSETEMSQSCKQISLACKGGSKFPMDFKFPHLSFLKLMQGDHSLIFPENLYGEMQNLRVIAYDQMKYAPLPASFQPNLQTLCLHNCSLISDLSCIGTLLSLQVLSFANSGVKNLPSSFKNLKKLRLLDLTGCGRDLVIDDGVLENLVMIEELYMSVGNEGRNKGISFTDNNCKELAQISRKLSALDMEFFGNKAQLENTVFKKLERFRISVGCLLHKNMQSYENTLRLVTNRGELLKSRMNELFGKTEVLFLRVDGMNNLADVEVKSPRPSPQYSSFYKLRDLTISHCGELGYLFPDYVARALSRLESLTVSSCSLVEAFIHIENNGAQKVTFPMLKSLSLYDLPKLSCWCNILSVIELPELMGLRLSKLPNFTSIYSKKSLEVSSMSSNISEMRPLLNEEVVIPKLERLIISKMEGLKEMWPFEYNSSSEHVNVSMLKEIKVEKCDGLVNLFPCNPMPLLQHLEELEVTYCGSIEVLFNIDMDRLHNNIVECNSKLRSIVVYELGKLREIWRVKGVKTSDDIAGFEAVETIRIETCKRFRNVFTPTSTTSNFDMRALKELNIYECGESMGDTEVSKSSQEQQINVILKEEIEDDINLNNVAFPSNHIHNFNHLHHLALRDWNGVEVVFEIRDSPSSSRHQLATTIDQQVVFPYLEDLHLIEMENMSHVWKCSNWNEFLFLHKQHHPLPSHFYSLTTIYISYCNNIKYLFSPLMATLLSNLKIINILRCDGIEEIVSKIGDDDDDEDGELMAAASSSSSFASTSHAITTFFPHLHSLSLWYLYNLKHIGGSGGDGAKCRNNQVSFNNTATITSPAHDPLKFSQVGVVSWSLCQYSREIIIEDCKALSIVIPSYAVGQMQKLEKLYIWNCESLMEVFETQGMNSNTGVTEAAMLIKKNINVPQLFHLREIVIYDCDLLEYVFTFSTLESLRQLEKLKIEKCNGMKVIVKQEEEIRREQSDDNDDVVVNFPCLKSVELSDLPNLLGFFLGMNQFEWKSLEDLYIINCPQIKVFTSGHSAAQKLNFIHTSLGKHSLDSGLNFHRTSDTTTSSSPSTSTCTTSQQTPPNWSYHNLLEIHLEWDDEVKKIIPWNELVQVQKLERIHVLGCSKVEEIFEVELMEGTNTNTNTNTPNPPLQFPNLTHLHLESLESLKYIWNWKKNIPGRRLLQFPNLTTLIIEGCDELKHVFISSMVGSLLQLQHLQINHCDNIKVIVKEDKEEEEEDCDGRVMKQIELPRLKSLQLEVLENLKGFYLGKEAFSLPSLDTLGIKYCPKLTTFTNGHSITPELKVIDTTTYGMCHLSEDLNSFIINKRWQEEEE